MPLHGTESTTNLPDETYRALFHALDQAACVVDRVPERADGLRDYRYLAMNKAMREMFRTGDLSGESIRDHYPGEVDAFFDDCDRVLESGTPVRIERESARRGIVLEMFITRVEDPSPNRLLVVMRDVTRRKRADARRAYLLKLSDVLRPLTDPNAIQEAACRVLGEHLDVDRVQYGELDLDRRVITITRDYYRGTRDIEALPSVAAEFSFDVFSAHADAWLARRSLVVRDTERDPSLSESERAGMMQYAVRASVSTPLIKDGVPVVVLAALSFAPRQWSDDDVALLEETADRTWEAVERARVEAALRVSRERLQRIINIEGVGVLTFREDGTLLDANDAFLQLLGYTRDDVASGTMTWRQLTPAEYVQVSEREMEKLAQTNRVGPYEKEILTRDGKRLWCLFAGAALGDGTIVEYCLDISAEKRSEARYRTLFESIEQGFCILQVMVDEGGDIDCRYLEVNPAFERLTGLTNVAGRTMRELIPDVRRHWLEVFWRVAATGHRERIVDHANRIGRSFEVEAFRIGEEEERQVAVLFSDITERTEAERQQIESDRRKDEFLAVLGHELRNPLAPIRTGLDLLEQARKNPVLLDSLQPMMQRQVLHLTRLVDDLLDMARVSRGMIELRQAPLNLNHAIEAAIEQVRTLVTQRRQLLTVHLARHPLAVEGDFERLTQVVANLLTNAVKYTKPAGDIIVSSSQEGDEAVVRVRDTGYGIPPERLGQLFEFFVKVPEHRQVDGGSGGLGIGLALTRQLVELHGGSIRAASEGLGHGSEFIVRLPISVVAQRPAPSPIPGDGSRATRRILVVDDNVDAAESLRILLSLKGHAVEVANDGPAALLRFGQFAPEIVLLDLGMPGWDGIEVARRIRAVPSGANVQLVAVTGWGQESDRRRTREAGFDHHLTKPVGLKALLELVAKA